MLVSKHSKVTIIRTACIGVRFMEYNLESGITLTFTVNGSYPKGAKTVKRGTSEQMVL